MGKRSRKRSNKGVPTVDLSGLLSCDLPVADCIVRLEPEVRDLNDSNYLREAKTWDSCLQNPQSDSFKWAKERVLLRFNDSGSKPTIGVAMEKNVEQVPIDCLCCVKFRDRSLLESKWMPIEKAGCEHLIDEFHKDFSWCASNGLRDLPLCEDYELLLNASLELFRGRPLDQSDGAKAFKSHLAEVLKFIQIILKRFTEDGPPEVQRHLSRLWDSSWGLALWFKENEMNAGRSENKSRLCPLWTDVLSNFTGLGDVDCTGDALRQGTFKRTPPVIKGGYNLRVTKPKSKGFYTGEPNDDTVSPYVRGKNVYPAVTSKEKVPDNTYNAAEGTATKKLVENGMVDQKGRSRVSPRSEDTSQPFAGKSSSDRNDGNGLLVAHDTEHDLVEGKVEISPNKSLFVCDVGATVSEKDLWVFFNVVPGLTHCQLLYKRTSLTGDNAVSNSVPNHAGSAKVTYNSTAFAEEAIRTRNNLTLLYTPIRVTFWSDQTHSVGRYVFWGDAPTRYFPK